MKLDGKLLWALIGTTLTGIPLFVLGVILDKSPTQVSQALGAWAPAVPYLVVAGYTLLGLFALAAVSRVSYLWGARVERNKSPAPVAPVVAPPRRGQVNHSIDDLIFSVREIVTILSEKGRLRSEELQSHIIRLRGQNTAWSVELAYQLSRAFLTAAEEAQNARPFGGNSVYAIRRDFPVEKREPLLRSLNERAAPLLAELDRQKHLPGGVEVWLAA